MKISPVLTAVLAALPVAIETVTVGNPGNAGDPIEFQGVFGAVDYEYAIAKYEVTAGQYAAFLNAVAATDPYGLYNVNMWAHETGCKIERTGSPGSYTYAVAPDLPLPGVGTTELRGSPPGPSRRCVPVPVDVRSA